VIYCGPIHPLREAAGLGHPVICAVEQPLFRALPIFGGTTEIQNEIIARGLGL